MVADTFVCPRQTTETFSFDVCRSCSAFHLSRGEHLSVKCSKNREQKHKTHFATAFYLDFLGRPYTVEIEGEKEARTKGHACQ